MKDVTRLKNHLKVIENELYYTTKQIKLLEKNHLISEWQNIENIDGKSFDELKIKEKNLSNEINQIKNDIKKSQSKTLLITEISLLPILVLLFLVSGFGDSLTESINADSSSLKSRYLIENLSGDTVDTWKSWRLVGTTLNVNILNTNGLSEERINKIKEAIQSENLIEVDDSLTHKGPKGFTSKYFEGWTGALKQAQKENTSYNIPSDFNILTSSRGEGDIIITLSNLRDSDGYNGYTKSIVEGNEILKSFITIYEVNNLSDEELGTILRHEFGHAIGLGHSSAPEDLMAPYIDMTVPYISECNVDAIVELYNGIQGSTVCKK